MRRSARVLALTTVLASACADSSPRQLPAFDIVRDTDADDSADGADGDGRTGPKVDVPVGGPDGDVAAPDADGPGCPKAQGTCDPAAYAGSGTVLRASGVTHHGDGPFGVLIDAFLGDDELAPSTGTAGFLLELSATEGAVDVAAFIAQLGSSTEGCGPGETSCPFTPLGYAFNCDCLPEALNGSIQGGVLDAGGDDAVLPFELPFFDSAGMPLTIFGARLKGTVAKGDDGLWSLRDGVLTGAVRSDEVNALLDQLEAQGNDSDEIELVRQVVAAFPLDVDTDGDGAGDAWPVGYVFEAVTPGSIGCPKDDGLCTDADYAWPGLVSHATALQVGADGKPGNGLDLDGKGEDDCAPAGNCSAGVDNALSFWSGSANSGLAELVDTGSLVILFEASAQSGDVSVAVVEGAVDSATAGCDVFGWFECGFLASTEAFGCTCEPDRLEGTIGGDFKLDVGGPGATIVLPIDLFGAGTALGVPLRNARIVSEVLPGDEAGVPWLALVNGVLGGAVHIDDLNAAVDEAAGGTGQIGGIPIATVKQTLGSIPLDIDTDGDGADDALSIGFRFESLPGVISGTIP